MRKLCVLSIVLFILVSLIGASAEKPKSFVVKGGDERQTVHIAYSEDSNGLVKEFAEVFAERLSDITENSVHTTVLLTGLPIQTYRTGNSIQTTGDQRVLSTFTDFTVYLSVDYDNSLYVEYLTEKYNGLLPFVLESESEWDKFCGNVSIYSMYVDESGLHINASDEWALYWAIDNLLNEIEESETYAIDVGTKILPDDEYVFPDPTVFIGKDKNPYFAVTESVATLPTSKEYLDYTEGMQGGGTDGEFAYVGTDGYDEFGKLFKYSLPEWELEEVSEPIVVYHVNDISYIEDENLLIAAHCDDEKIRSFSYIDAATMEVLGFGSIPVDCWGLEYDDANERFIVEADWKNYIFDKDFNLIKEMPYGDSDGTPQSLYIEGDYIFDVRWDMGWLRNSGIPFKNCDFQNYIMIHDYENVYVERAYIPQVTGEPEFIFRHGNMYYIGYIHNVIDGVENPVGIIYEFILLPEIWWN